MPLLSPPCSRKERAATERMFSWFCALCSREYRMAKEYARPLMPVKAKLILLTPAATDQNTLNNAKTAQDRKPRCACSTKILLGLTVGTSGKAPPRNIRDG